MKIGSGIGFKSRERLEALHRAMRGPFSVEEAAVAWDVDGTKARRLLAHLARQGWLSRVRRNCYTTVPLGATAPREWREDPWAVAAKTFAPCYLGGWTACEHWGLTEQIFREILVITTRRVRHRREEIQGTTFRVKVVAGDRLFGMRDVWRGPVKLAVSDPTRTVIDLLDDPALGGGMRHVFEVLSTYLEGSERDDNLLLAYGTRMEKGAVFKRLGYLAEILGAGTESLRELCRSRITTGISSLDPGSRTIGPIVKRWGLRVNVNLEAEAR